MSVAERTRKKLLIVVGSLLLVIAMVLLKSIPGYALAEKIVASATTVDSKTKKEVTKYYTTLSAALYKSEVGSTIKLEKDVSGEKCTYSYKGKGIDIYTVKSKNHVIDLNGKTWTTNGDFAFICGTGSSDKDLIKIIDSSSNKSGKVVFKDKMNYLNYANANLQLAGGTYNKDITDYVASGYWVYEKSKGSFQVLSGDQWLNADNKLETKPDVNKILNHDSSAYLLYDAEDLKKFSRFVNTGTQFTYDTVKLGADIDLSSVTNWEPIGNENNPLTLVFDGQDHKISNLKINYPEESCAFIRSTTKDVKNITFNNVSVSGYENVAAVVAKAGHGVKIEHVHVKGRIEVTGCCYVGGIIAEGYASVDHCSVEADQNSESFVKGTNSGGSDHWTIVGGIRGFSSEGDVETSNVTVKNLTVSGKSAIGGVIGNLHYGNTVDDATVENCKISTTSAESIGVYVGGIAGRTVNGAPITLRKCRLVDTSVRTAYEDGEELVKASPLISCGAYKSPFRDGDKPEIPDNIGWIVDGTNYETFTEALDVASEMASGDNKLYLYKNASSETMTRDQEEILKDVGQERAIHIMNVREKDVLPSRSQGSPYSFGVNIHEWKLCFDEDPPTVEIKVEGKNWIWTALLDKITFGNYRSNKTEKVTIDAKDEGTGIDRVYYYLTKVADLKESDLEALSSDEWQEYVKPFSLDPVDRYIVYVKALDQNGHKVYASTDGIVVDDMEPVVAGIISGNSYTVESVKTFTIEDTNLEDITVNGVSVKTSLIWEDGKYKYSLSPGANQTVVARDTAGNEVVISNVSVLKGQSKPVLKEQTTAHVYDGGPYVVNDTSSIGKAYSYRYSKEEPGKVEVTYDTDKYQLFAGPISAQTKLPTTYQASPASLKTDTVYYIRKKSIMEEGKLASDFVRLTIPAIQLRAISLVANPKSQGFVGFGTDSATEANALKTVYEGQSVTIIATPKSGYKFSKWVNVKGETLVSKVNPYTCTVNNDMSLRAVFVKENQNNLVEIPSPKTSFTYNGTEKVSLASAPEGASLSGDSRARATYAGNYTFTLTLNNGKMWTDGTKEPKRFSWSIRKSSQSAPTGISYDEGDQMIKGLVSSEKYEIKLGANGTIAKIDNPENYKPTDTVNVNDEKVEKVKSGTYYIRVSGDDNHEASPWTIVKVVKPTVTISASAPNQLTENSVVVNAILSATDDVDDVKVRYRKRGETTWSESEVELNIRLTCELTSLVSDTEYEYQFIADYDRDGSAEKIESKIVTFKTIAEAKKGDIVSLLYNEDTKNTKNVTITIEKGNIILATQTVTVPARETVASEPFNKLDDGVYNIVVKTNDGLFTETKSITIKNASSEIVSFSIKKGELSTVVEIKTSDTPPIAVEGLSKVITNSEEKASENGEASINVVLEAEKQTKEKLENSGDKEKLNEFQTLENEIKNNIVEQGKNEQMESVLDLNLTKTKTNLDQCTGEATSISVEDIGKVNEVVMEIAIPRTTDPNGKKKIIKKMVRLHDNIVEELTKLKTKPEGAFIDATFYVSSDYVYVYASGFSLYALITGDAEEEETKPTDTPANEEDVEHKHTPVVDEAVPATCTETGLTEGSHCADPDCETKVIVKQEEIPALGHDWSDWTVVKEATDTSPGKKERICKREGCGVKEEEEIPMSHSHSHTIVVDKGVPATCTETGLTEGSHCADISCEIGVLVKQEVVPALGHDWSDWTITKAATFTATGTRVKTCKRKNCGEKITETIPKLTAVSKADEQKNILILNEKLVVMPKNKQIDISWGMIKDATGYEIYGAYCGDTMKHIASVKNPKTTKITIKKLNGKALNLKKNYKFYVVAYKLVNKKVIKLGTTVVAHIVGVKNTSYTNAKSITVKKTSYTLAKGKSVVISAKTNLVSPNKKQLTDSHTKEFRYATSNKAIATVSTAGNIKAIKAGTCYVYVYSRNGLAKKIKVTVK